MNDAKNVMRSVSITDRQNEYWEASEMTMQNETMK